MSLDLFAAWGAAIAAGRLPKHVFLFRRFQPWLLSRNVQPENLDRVTYMAFFADMALQGLSPRGFGKTDTQIRQAYRWAANTGLIPDVPFGDYPVIKPITALSTSISENELFQIIDCAIQRARDETRLPRERMRSARAGLMTALAYFSGLGTKQQSDLTAAEFSYVLQGIRDGRVPEQYKRAALCYAELYDAIPNAGTNALFLSSFWTEEVGKLDHAHSSTAVASYKRLTGSNSFLRGIVEIAEAMDLPQPERFTVAEILRARKARLHQIPQFSIPGFNTTTMMTSHVYTPRDWDDEEVIALARLHPGFSA